MFTSLAAVDAYLDNENLECLICGLSYKSLHRHVYRTHNLRADEYKEKFGIPYTKGLVGTVTRKKLSIAAIELHENNPNQSSSLLKSTNRVVRRNPPGHVLDSFVGKGKEKLFERVELIKALIAIKSGLMMKDLIKSGYPSRQTLNRQAGAEVKFKKVFERAKAHQLTLKEGRVVSILKQGKNQIEASGITGEGLAFVRRIKNSM